MSSLPTRQFHKNKINRALTIISKDKCKLLNALHPALLNNNDVNRFIKFIVQ